MSRPDDDATSDVERALRDAARDPVVLEQPPAEVWDRVLAAREEAPAPVHASSAATPLRLRTGALVGALGLVVGVALGVVIGRQGSQPDAEQQRPLASGVLTPLAGHASSGSVRIYEAAGQRTVRIHLVDAGAGGGFVEAWLFEPGTTKMIALGMVTRPTQSFAVPDDVDLGVYRSVDISVEPLDGDPAHSAVSVARGDLQR